MITQDNIAAATLAQIFGSELMRVDEYTTQQSNMTGPAVKINPKQFLIPNNNNQFNMRADERRIIEAVNREAEMSYPRNDMPPAPQPVYQQQAPAPPILQQTIAPIGSVAQTLVTDPNQMEFSFPPPGSPAFELFVNINKNLERIAKAIENIEIPPVKERNKL